MEQIRSAKRVGGFLEPFLDVRGSLFRNFNPVRALMAAGGGNFGFLDLTFDLTSISDRFLVDVGPFLEPFLDVWGSFFAILVRQVPNGRWGR